MEAYSNLSVDSCRAVLSVAGTLPVVSSTGLSRCQCLSTNPSPAGLPSSSISPQPKPRPTVCLLSSGRCSDLPTLRGPSAHRSVWHRQPSSKLGRRPTSPESMLSPILPCPETPDRQSGNVPGPRLWMRDGAGDSWICNGSEPSVFVLSDC